MEEFDYADFVSEERIVPDEKLGKYNLPFILLPAVFLFIFVINFGAGAFLIGVNDFFTLANLFLIFTAGFLVHELLHFLTWQGLSRFPIQEFRIGMRWNSFTPVIGCQRPMKVKPLMIGLLVPYLVQGVLPLVFAFYLANTWLLFASVIFMAWASADILTFLLLWKVDKGGFAEMHRSKLGVVVFNRKPVVTEDRVNA